MTASLIKEARPAGDSSIQTARRLVPLLRENAERAEAERRLPDETVRALEEAGMFAMTRPQRFGGSELNIRPFVDTVIELARGCGATAWTTMILNGVQWSACKLGDDALSEVFDGNPNARIAGVVAQTTVFRRVEGGIVVSGSWPFASGCLHADWAFIGVPVLDANGEVIEEGQAFVPMSDLTIKDTWHVAGMSATGSNTMVAEEVFIPDHRILGLESAAEGRFPSTYAGSVYKGAIIPTLAVIACAPMIGMAQSMLELSLERIKGRKVSYTLNESSKDSPTVQLQFAEAATKIDTALLHARRTADLVDSYAAAGETMPYLERARCRMDVGWVSRQTREAIELLLDVNGASGFAEATPLQRIWRNCEVASRHGMLTPPVTQEIYGRALVGAAQIAKLV
jgi:3-hydroxy-9,10-secoandrosta-1,3,5(10)-triene-9,17-dione monooxygenase